MTKFGSSHYRPYIFLLQEGKTIKKDPLDYSLRLLQLDENQTLPAPNIPSDPPPFRGPYLYAFAQELKKAGQS
jgi:hypothetical protein